MFRKNLTAGIVFLLAAGVALAWSSFSQSKKQPAKDKIVWQPFEKAVAQAVKEKKLLVVDFYTDWCGWCKKMDSDTYGDARVVDFARKNLVMSKVNAESRERVRYKGHEFTYAQLARAFGVKGYPTTVFIDSKGDFITAVSGYLTPPQFLPILEYLSGGHYLKMTFEQFLKKKKEDES